MGGFRLVFGPFIHQEGLDEVIAYYGFFSLYDPHIWAPRFEWRHGAPAINELIKFLGLVLHR